MRDLHKVAVVSSSLLSCEGLRHILDPRQFQIITTWPTIEDALTGQSDTVGVAATLLDSSRRALPSRAVLGELRSRYGGSRLVLVGETCDPARIQEAMEADVDGYLVETTRPEVFSKALELIVFGERIFPVSQLRQILVQGPEAVGQADSAFEELSDSQMQVLALLAEAYPNKLIARKLGISESTVKVHVKAILRKTGARNRTDVALRARGLAGEGHGVADTSDQALREPTPLDRGAAPTEPPTRPAGGDVADLQLRRQAIQYRARCGQPQDAALPG